MFGQNRCASALLVFHIVNILQQSSRLSPLTIDNRLTHAGNVCYTRISVGSKLPDVDISLRTDVVGLPECEENCSKHRNNCTAFSFGVGAKGNSSCLISARLPSIENFQTHPEYDVYVKNWLDWLSCDTNHFYAISSPARQSSNVSTKLEDETSKKAAHVSDQRSPLPIWIPQRGPSHSRRNKPLDIIGTSEGKATATTEEPGVGNCHRRMQAGKRMMERFVERVANCEHLEDCCRLCHYERAFVCKAFNHRRGIGDTTKCICELTSSPYSRMDFDQDFLIDTECDYYEWTENCLATASRGDVDFLRGRNDRFDPDGHEFPPSKLGSPRSYSDDYIATRTNYRELFGPVSTDETTFNWNTDSNAFVSRYPAALSDDTGAGRRSTYGSLVESDSPLDDRPSVSEFFEPDEYEYSSEKRTNDYHAPPKCSFKAVSGTRLNKAVLRKASAADSLARCEDFCIGETSFSCETYSYRYDRISSNPVDNCLLSSHSYHDLNFYTDLEPDRDYDIYVTMSDVKSYCSNESARRNPYSSEECFSRVKSGFTIPLDATRRSLSANNFGECQFACVATQEFVCKCFVYKYEGSVRPIDGTPSANCFLTDSASDEIDPIDMPDMDGAELFERNAFPYGCDISTPVSRIPNIHTAPDDAGRFHSTGMDEPCYTQHHRPCKLMPHAIVSSARTSTMSDCRQRCSAMRNTGPIPCMSFDYTANAPTPARLQHARDNCFLSDISLRDLRPNLDYIEDNDHTLYTWTEHDPRCATTNVATSTTRWSSKFLTDQRNEYGFDHYFHSRIRSAPFGRYTVNGYPCKGGTFCRQNRVAGFWSCETEDGHDSWDYCCQPNHQCGFSKGYHSPWCYVGSDETQWRPCSETYYPYHFSNQHSTYRQTSATQAARHWPLIYVHETPPPNCSTDHRYPSSIS